MNPGSGGRRSFGRYEVVRLIGEGGMATVFEAVHEGLRKRVALKVLLPSVAALPGARTRFLREARAAARIRHPNVVDVTDVGLSEEAPYLVMELLEGETLADYLARKGPLPLTKVVSLALPVIAGIAAGHEAGVIHRDLKPQNIFLARHIRGIRIPKVLDFGLSRLDDESCAAETGEGTGVRFGTSAYLSPEQASGAAGDARSDQYAIGLLAYECATGRPAHEGESVYALMRAIVDGLFEPLRARRPEFPAAFEAVVTRAMSVEPGDRFPSLHGLGRALLPFASERARERWTSIFSA